MIAREEFPQLAHLIDCYFFQNWDEVYGHDEENVLRALMAQEERAVLLALRDDLTRFLSRGYTREEMRAFVDSLGVGYMDEDVGQFLTEFRDALDRHLAAS